MCASWAFCSNHLPDCLGAFALRQHPNQTTVAPYELIGAALGLLLVLRTNGGYERWWEARKLADFLAWIAILPYCCMAKLRGEKPSAPIFRLLGDDETNRLATTGHMPMAVAAKLGMTMLVAYPLFALDQLGVELQNPFDNENLSLLPLEDISAAIEKNISQNPSPPKANISAIKCSHE